ncbi:unknown [Bacteroides intestinalis CAG:315]|jgi:hypothetical protein|uniref:Uncharacterized protein n=1 Tax=Bacteroides intestinalis TaxID=329854 RepID=A0A412YBG8_9BACE|nr:hypothetical protein DWW10_09820 [Bacteroides intestinalis]RHA62755.1 hypothetical protein DW932_03545 [Bacteroides intestinalis]CDD94574.1 unknown [Bacteroides intestinalis CAG:315]
MFTPLLKHRAWTVFYLFVFGFTRASLFDKYEQRHAFFYFFGEDYEKKFVVAVTFLMFRSIVM